MYLYPKFLTATGLFTIFYLTTIPVWSQTDRNNTGSLLEEVIVTAQKRAENVQEVPMAITALTEEDLKAARIQNVLDVATNTPNFFIQQPRVSSPNLTIRGVGSNFRQGQAGIDRSVITYVDEVYQGRAGGAVFDLFDIERVEVLRGPQGTLFGRNAMGGAVHIVTKKPSQDPYATFQGGVGKFSLTEFQGVVNGPLTDNLAAKISFSQRDRDGVNRNLFAETTPEDIDTINTANVRAQLKYNPNNDIEAIFTADFSRDRVRGNIERPTNNEALFSPEVLGFELPDNFRDFKSPIEGGDFNREIYGFSGHLTWDTPIGTVQSITSYRNLKFDEDFEALSAPSGPEFTAVATLDTIPGFLSRQQGIEDTSAFTQELRLESGAEGTSFDRLPGRFLWTVGTFIMDEDTYQEKEFERVLALVDGGITSSNNVSLQDSTTTSYAVFANIIYEISDQLRISFGARQTWDDKDIVVEFRDLDPNRTRTNALTPGIAAFPPTEGSETFKKFTPKASISYFPDFGLFKNTETMFYATISRGFKSGGFDGTAGAVQVAGTPVKEEEAHNYEVGFKSRFFNDQVQLNGTFFWVRAENLQLEQVANAVPGDPGTRTTIVANAAESRIRGIEADAMFQPFRSGPLSGFILSGNVGFQDSEFTDPTLFSALPGLDPAGLEPARGQQLPFAPRVTSTITGSYQFPVGNGHVTLRASNRYTSENFFDLGLARPEGVEDDYNVTDASITFVPNESGPWEFRFWAKNIFDTEFFVERQPISGGVTAIGRVGDPLTFGGTVTWSMQ